MKQHHINHDSFMISTKTTKNPLIPLIEPKHPDVGRDEKLMEWVSTHHRYPESKLGYENLDGRIGRNRLLFFFLLLLLLSSTFLFLLKLITLVGRRISSPHIYPLFSPIFCIISVGKRLSLFP